MLGPNQQPAASILIAAANPNTDQAYAPTDIDQLPGDVAVEETGGDIAILEAQMQTRLEDDIVRQKKQWGLFIQCDTKQKTVLSVRGDGSVVYSVGNGSDDEDIVINAAGTRPSHLFISPIPPSSMHRQFAMGYKIRRGNCDPAEMRVVFQPGFQKLEVVKDTEWLCYSATELLVGLKGAEVRCYFFPSGGIRIVKDIWIGKRIGNGNEGEVYKGQSKETTDYDARNPGGRGFVGIKLLLGEGVVKGKRETWAGKEIEKAGGHPNVAAAFESNVDDAGESTKLLFIDWAPGHSLDKLLGHPDLKKAVIGRKFLLNIVDAVLWLHGLFILNFDLKPANLLVTHSNLEFAVLKVADFGVSRRYQPGVLLKGLHGTKVYCAPEIDHPSVEYCPKLAEAYSVGLTLLHIFGFNRIETSPNVFRPTYPFADLKFTNTKVIEKICSTVVPIEDHEGQNTLCSLLTALLQSAPIDRLGLDNVRRQDWVAHPSAVEEMWVEAQNQAEEGEVALMLELDQMSNFLELDYSSDDRVETDAAGSDSAETISVVDSDHTLHTKNPKLRFD